jgi:hypothetical protein
MILRWYVIYITSYICLNNHYFNSVSQYVENGEDVNILHYEVGQKYLTHSDYFSNEINIRNGGQRTATMLMYL